VGESIRADTGILDGLNQSVSDNRDRTDEATGRIEAHVSKGWGAFCSSLGAAGIAAALFVVTYVSIRVVPKAPGWL